MIDTNTIILVTTEHCDDCVEMYFTTIGAYQQFMEEIYGEDFIEIEYSSLNDANCELDHETGCVDLFTAMEGRASLWFLTKHRSVWLHTVREDEPIPLDFIEAEIGDNARYLEMTGYIGDCPELVWNMLNCGVDYFKSNRLSEGELQHTINLQILLRDKLIGGKTEEEFMEEFYFYECDHITEIIELFSLYSNSWSSCFGPEDLPERLATIGVPQRCYE